MLQCFLIFNKGLCRRYAPELSFWGSNLGAC